MERVRWENAGEAHEYATLQVLLPLQDSFIGKGRIKSEPPLPIGSLPCGESSIKVRTRHGCLLCLPKFYCLLGALPYSSPGNKYQKSVSKIAFFCCYCCFTSRKLKIRNWKTVRTKEKPQ